MESSMGVNRNEEKRDNMKKTTNDNTQKLKKAKKYRTKLYPKEQLEYSQVQINKIRNSVGNRQSQLA